MKTSGSVSGKKIRITLLVWDAVAILLIFFSLFMVFETVIKNLLVDSNIHAYRELTLDVQSKYRDAVTFTMNKPFLPYKESVLSIVEYVKTYSLHKLGLAGSLVMIASQDAVLGSSVSTNKGPAGFPGDYGKFYLAAAKIPAELPEEAYRRLLGSLGAADVEKLNYFYRLDEGSKTYRLHGFPGMDEVEVIRQLTLSPGQTHRPNVDFSVNGREYIGVADFLPVAAHENLDRAAAGRFNPIIILADTRDDFFFQINNIRNLFMAILGGIVLLVFGIKVYNTFMITREINAIKGTIMEESAAIGIKGEIGTALGELGLVFSETTSLYDSYSGLSKKLGEVGEIIAGIADRDLFVATLKNDKSVLEPHEKDMAVLFLDVQGFTTIAETYREKSMSIINRIWAEVESKVSGNCGKINKYMGDAALIIFPEASGPASSKASPAKNAIIAGMEILESVDGLKKELAVGFNFRIGIDYGRLVYGKTGSDKNYELGVIGDPVNTAARFEELNKQYNTNILVSGEALGNAGFGPGKAAELFADSGRKQQFFRIDHARPKGKKDAKDIYTVTESEKDGIRFAGSPARYPNEAATEYKNLMEELLAGVALWGGKTGQEGRKKWAQLARRIAELPSDLSFPPAARLLQRLISNEEMEKCRRDPGAWLAQKEIPVLIPDADWIKYGAVELSK